MGNAQSCDRTEHTGKLSTASTLSSWNRLQGDLALKGDPSLFNGYFRRIPALVQDPCHWGMKLHMLKQFQRHVAQDLAIYCDSHGLDNQWQHVTLEQAVRPLLPNMHIVVDRYVRPWTAPIGCGYAIAINILTRLTHKLPSFEEQSKADVFVTHCWNELFSNLVQTLGAALDDDETVWICSFAIDQNQDITTLLGQDMTEAPFWSAMRGCSRVVACLDEAAEPFERAWCVIEIYLALHQFKLPYSIGTSAPLNAELWDVVGDKVKSIDLQNCKATVDDDRRKILRFIDSDCGIQKLNSFIQRQTHEAVRAGKLLRLASVGDEALFGDMDKMRQEHGCDPFELVNAAGHSLLHSAAAVGQAATVSKLIDANAPIEARTYHADTPLHLAMRTGSLCVLPVLLNAGANIGAINDHDYTPLMEACKHGHAEVSQLLIHHKADIESSHPRDGTALVISAMYQHTGTVRLLLQEGAAINAAGSSNTALHMAGWKGNLEITELLCLSKADLEMRTDNRGTPLLTAARFACDQTNSGAKVVQCLVEHGASIKARDAGDKTALHCAARSNTSTRVQRYLRQLGLSYN